MNAEAMTWPVGCRECFGYGESALVANPFNSSQPSCALTMASLACLFSVPFAASFAGGGTTGFPCAAQNEHPTIGLWFELGNQSGIRAVS